jgi:AcrR family transcriptional regulator
MIMDAALREFCARGYAATTLEDVAAATPVARQTLYNHFGEKEKLFLATVDQELTATLDALRRAVEVAAQDVAQVRTPEDALGHLTDLGRRVLNTFTDPRTAALRLLVQSEAPRHPALLELWRARSATPVWAGLVGQLAHMAHNGALEITFPVRAAGQYVTLVTGVVGQMTEYGTLTPADQPPQAARDAALAANVELFVRAHHPSSRRLEPTERSQRGNVR